MTQKQTPPTREIGEAFIQAANAWKDLGFTVSLTQSQVPKRAALTISRGDAPPLYEARFPYQSVTGAFGHAALLMDLWHEHYLMTDALALGSLPMGWNTTPKPDTLTHDTPTPDTPGDPRE